MFKCLQISEKPTPLSALVRLSDSIGHPVYVKRDDLYCSESLPGGTSVRKLEFLMPDVAKSNTTDLVIVGRYGSSYMLNAVLLAATVGISSHCVFVDQFDRGAHSQFLSQLHLAGASTYDRKGPEFVNWLIDELKSKGLAVYVSPYEGSNTLALVGGYSLMAELHLDTSPIPDSGLIRIYVPLDSGTTFAGMHLYLREHGLGDSIQLIGVPVFGTLVEHQSLALAAIAKLCQLCLNSGFDEHAKYLSGLNSVLCSEVSDYSSIDGYKRIEMLRKFYQSTDLLLDTTYTAHAAAAMLEDIQSGNHAGTSVLVCTTSAKTPYFSYGAE